MLRSYETLWIANPNLTAEEVDALVTEMEGIVRSGNGTLVNVDKQGKRRLNYRVSGHREGYYTLFELKAESTVMTELERKMRLHENVIRYLTVAVDEEKRRAEKLAGKRKAKKDKRAKKKGISSDSDDAAGGDN